LNNRFITMFLQKHQWDKSLTMLTIAANIYMRDKKSQVLLELQW
jgi:hypothetical protein